MCEEKYCTQCKQNKPITDFYKRRNGTGISSYCKPCTNNQVLNRQRALKTKAIEYKGGKCQCCGYDKYQGALEFHHINPNEKDFSLASVKLTSFNKKIQSELDKCILVCSNCHREIHGGVITIENQNISTPHSGEWNKSTVDLSGIKSEDIKEKIPKTNNKIEWPSDNELSLMVWKIPRVQLAKQLGVSDNAIIKRCKLRNIPQPPRGYWAKVAAGINALSN